MVRISVLARAASSRATQRSSHPPLPYVTAYSGYVPIAAVLAIDIVLTVAFAAIGRASHAEGLDLAGVAGTAWPFVAGLVIGWAICLFALRREPRTLAASWPIWIITVVVGMLLRRATGDGTALAFIIVATVTLAAFLLGWRLLARRALIVAPKESA